MTWIASLQNQNPDLSSSLFSQNSFAIDMFLFFWILKTTKRRKEKKNLINQKPWVQGKSKVLESGSLTANSDSATCCISWSFLLTSVSLFSYLYNGGNNDNSLLLGLNELNTLEQCLAHNIKISQYFPNIFLYTYWPYNFRYFFNHKSLEKNKFKNAPSIGISWRTNCLNWELI